VEHLCRDSVELPFEILTGVDELSHSKSSYPARLIDPYIHDGERIYGIGVTRYLKDHCRILNFTNYNTKEEDLTVWVYSRNTPELFIPETGEIRTVTPLEQKNGGYLFSFTIPQNRAIFVVCSL
jgi:hypothetical protein